MNNSLVITVLAVIAVIIVVLLLVIITMLNKNSEAKNNSNTNGKRDYKVSGAGGTLGDSVPMPNVMATSFPNAIEKLSKRELLSIVRKVYESYKIFDYQKMDIYELDKKEWHSWQISFLLMLYKQNEEFFIPNQESIFHDSLLNCDENDMKSLMRGMIKKYQNYVNPNHTKDALCKEYIWSNKDVSIMFYFLANFKKYKS